MISKQIFEHREKPFDSEDLGTEKSEAEAEAVSMLNETKMKKKKMQAYFSKGELMVWIPYAIAFYVFIIRRSLQISHGICLLNYFDFLRFLCCLP